MRYIVTRIPVGPGRHVDADMEYIDGVARGAGDGIKVHYSQTSGDPFRFDRKSTAARVVQAMAEPGYMVGIIAVEG